MHTHNHTFLQSCRSTTWICLYHLKWTPVHHHDETHRCLYAQAFCMPYDQSATCRCHMYTHISMPSHTCKHSAYLVTSQPLAGAYGAYYCRTHAYWSMLLCSTGALRVWWTVNHMPIRTSMPHTRTLVYTAVCTGACIDHRAQLNQFACKSHTNCHFLVYHRAQSIHFSLSIFSRMHSFTQTITKIRIVLLTVVFDIALFYWLVWIVM